MLKSFEEMLEVHQMLSASGPYIVGLSGGVDSVVLLHLLKEKTKDIVAVHINHGLRGQEADEDEAFVKELCKEWGIRLELFHVELTSLAKKQGVSIELAGRNVRYKAFDEVAKKYGANRIFLAHHGNDQAETILMRLIRGTGLEGLKGIQPIRENRYYRPLLTTLKEDLYGYAKEHQLDYREDASNEDNLYRRNKVRNHLIPLIEENYNPNLVKGLMRTASLLAADEAYLRALTEEAYQDFKGSDYQLSRVANQPLAMQRRLCKALIEDLLGARQDISFEEVEQVRNMIVKGVSGHQFDLKGVMTLRVSYGYLTIAKGNHDQWSIPLALGEFIRPPYRILISDTLLHPESQWIQLDKALLEKGLVLRNKKPGDVFQPAGFGGRHKKLKKYFIDEKIPAPKRQEIPLLADKEHIYWVLGYRKSELLKAKQGGQATIYVQVLMLS